MKTMLITGGSGFLGQALAKRFSPFYRVVLVARNNANNSNATMETGCESVPLDVSSMKSIMDVMGELSPNIVIHAAATKYVNISEQFPMECVDVNVLGSQNLLRASIDKGVEKILGISTDKAAPPVGNIYGLSKAIMERMYCGVNGHSNIKSMCVRFGNIAWSTGSVFPVWKKMAKQNGKILTTGPHMRRFFFSVSDACSLVEKALSNIDSLAGGILSKKMKSVQIEDILKIFAKRWNVPWEKVGSRPGDKIDEVLIGQLEIPHTQEITIKGDPYYWINHKKIFAPHIVDEVNTMNAERLSEKEILNLIRL